MSNQSSSSPIVFDNQTPTLFVDFDGTLHRGHALIDDRSGEVSLDTGNPMFEFARMLASMLEPYPTVEIVLTTSWLYTLPFDKVVSYLPSQLAERVVGSTRGYKARFGYLQDGSAKTYIIRAFVFDKHLKNWLALDDSVYGSYHLSTDFLPLDPHLVLLDGRKGIGDEGARQRVIDWLTAVHSPRDE